ncbi:MAG TPA: MerR family transcriptional regulator [Streptosporangiaceae bacterium]|jgi:DNA-binding transcriptional MerR regulator
MTLMGIGEFAQRSRLSPKALRLYDELGLLTPARVDPDSGYRWYCDEQLERARLVASLRQLGAPLARIKVIADLDAGAAADAVGSYWEQAEAGHVLRRELAGYLVSHLNGKEFPMYDVTVRDMPARSMLCVLRHAHTQEHMALGRDMIKRLRPVAKPQPHDPVTAPFAIFHGEVSEDSDGPVEWCWPVPPDQAASLAARFPDLELRTEAAHQEAFVHVGQGRLDRAQLEPVVESLFAWTAAQHRQVVGGLRQLLVSNPESGGNGPDGEWAIALRP